MEIVDFLGIGIVGTALSLAVQYIKTRFGGNSTETKLLVVALSCACGSAYYVLAGTELWTSIVAILGFSTTFYAFFLK